ncbi:calmodulin binding protein PICBP-like [Actinidia eriantha]|uniref:calmodulin binding protein PICBP-like n=1 Tax=Actinidia eriantha TaxID=165200 RepID=UPI002582B9AF|nr:calmodulin binding protein PICBP-like [Actinidia eriantha]
MKKSKPIKRLDFESSRTTGFRRGVPQPGKPPTMDVQPGAATTQKQFPIKGSEAEPSYMKPTSSFEARRERFQVSSWNSKTSSNSKSVIKTSNNSKALTRTSSLKMVRTLTKGPSFKPARGSIKKCSQVVVCEDLNVQRATCSSTLKDSKFPTYLELSLGATESEGTSVMKVCPYTYCSLNGHRHAPLPPPKCFLAATRGTVKAQKKAELGCQSPRCAKPSADGMKETIIQEKTVDERAAVQEMDSNSSEISALMQEDQIDTFIEIYVNDAEDAAETTGGRKQNGDEHLDGTCFAADEHLEAETTLNFEPEETDSEISDIEWEEGQYSAQSLDGVGYLSQTNAAYDFENGPFFDDINPSSHHQSIFNSDDIVSSNFNEISVEEGPEELFDEEGARSGVGCSDRGSDSEGSFQNLVSDESMHVLNNQNYQPHPTCDVFEESTTEERDGTAESNDFKASAIISTATEEPIEQPREAREDENKVLEADEENPRNNLQLEDDETESTSSTRDEALIDCQENESIEDDEASTLPDNREHDSHSFTESHKDETCEDHNSSDNSEVYQSDAVSKEVLDGSLLPETEDSETNQSLKEELPTADDTDGMEKEHENAGKSLIRIPTFELLQVSSEAEEDKTEEDINEIQFSATARDDEPSHAFVSEGFVAETRVHSSDKQSQSNSVDEDQNLGSSEAEEDKTEEDNNEIQLGATARDDDSNQAFASEGFAAETKVHSSDEQSQSNNIDEDQNQSDKDFHEDQSFKIRGSMDSEDQTHSGPKQVSVTQIDNEDIDEMVIENPTMSKPEESFPSAENEASTQVKPAFRHGGGPSSQELPKPPNNMMLIRCKGSVENLEDPRKFDPREPNYLSIKPDPEAEKVDLRHLSMDETKNAEEWMLDYAIRQAVTKLAPARKRKVALLVEAFEKVMPIPKYESHLSHTQAAFAHARPIQACS